MRFTANWIWDDSSEYEKNYWLCFRKRFSVQDLQTAELYISADSRYTLYINGKWIGRGPNRFWPTHIEYDCYDVAHLLTDKENIIAVEVNHYGTSTSQYIHQPGGLYLQLNIIKTDGEKECICSDGTFLCKRSPAFSAHTSRVNVSQPYVEAYDARFMDERWKQVDYDDSDWQQCVPAEMNEAKKTSMVPCDIPPLTMQKKYARAVLKRQSVKVCGTNVTVDFSEAFYPNDTSTTDKLQTGYIATIIDSPTDIECDFMLVSKMWPFRKERFSINGKVTVMDVDQKTSRIHLCKGENLFILDVSGAYQRFYVDLYFSLDDLKFHIPQLGEDCFFAAVGPFDYAEIGNIVCAEGFKIDFNDDRYREAIHACDIHELLEYGEFIRPITSQRIDNSNIKVLTCQKEVIDSADVLIQDQNMIIANTAYTLVSPSIKDTEYIIDFGIEVSGYVNIELSADPGTIFDIIGFEYMGDTPEIPDDLNNSMRYIADDKRSSYLFHRRAGFRYLLITIRSNTSPCKIYEVSVMESSFPAAEVGRFSCSDEKLNRIWEISKDTLRLCMEDVFVDCPGFEQAFWIGDARNTALYQYYVYGSADIVKRSLLMAGRSLTRSNLPECHVPAGVSCVLPAWGLFWAVAGSDYYFYTGDTEFEKQLYPYIKRALNVYISYINNDGLFEIDAWNMLDWSDMDTPYRGIVTHQNGLLVFALQSSAKMAKRNGDFDTAAHFTSKAQALVSAINQHLWCEDEQVYVDCIREGVRSKVISLLTNAVLLLCGCVPDNRKERVLRLFNMPLGDIVDIGSPFASFFKYEVLASQTQYKRIVDDIRQQWGVMLEHDTTTCWETFIGFYKERLTRSYCHAWSSVPCYVFGRYVLGVIPTARGFTRVKIAPNPCGLQWAKGSVPTPHGIINVSWEQVDGEIVVKYDAPKTIDVEVVLGDV